MKVLEAELLGNRERYNTLFALAKRARPRLEGERFKANLERFVAPVVAAAEEGARDALVAALYPLTLELSGVELFTRSEAVCKLWTEVLPDGMSLPGKDQAFLVASLTNACYNIEKEPGADVAFWLGQMGKLCDRCEDGNQWLALAQVLAWVCGMAHYRESAVEVALGLPEELVASCVPRWDKVQSDPWWPRRPAQGTLSVAHRVGAFVGYGGAFQKPPEVVAAGPNRFLVSDGMNEWLLFCDGFGATLKRVVDFAIQDVAGEGVRVRENGEITWAGGKASFPEVAPVASFDAGGDVIAVTSRLSHSVYLFLGTP